MKNSISWILRILGVLSVIIVIFLIYTILNNNIAPQTGQTGIRRAQVKNNNQTEKKQEENTDSERDNVIDGTIILE